MRLGRIDEQAAEVGLSDGGERAESREFLDADFALAGLTEAGGVEDFDGVFIEVDFYAVDVASGALARGDESLLFFS